MRHPRGRRTAFFVIGLAAVVFGVVLFQIPRTALWNLPRLRSPDPEERWIAADRLIRARSARSIPEVLRAFVDDPAQLRTLSRRIFEAFGPAALSGLEVLGPAARHSSVLVRKAAVQALGDVATVGPGTLPFLAASLKDSSSDTSAGPRSSRPRRSGGNRPHPHEDCPRGSGHAASEDSTAPSTTAAPLALPGRGQPLFFSSTQVTAPSFPFI